MSTQGIDRRLSAVLSADVVGYSRLIEQDEDGTVRRLARCRRDIDKLVVEHGGRVVDFVGDNCLAEFPSVVEATRCAVDIQEQLAQQNHELEAVNRMQFRIGIHLGEVRVEGARIFGNPVNIAARLEALAEPGGICISALVHDQLRSKLLLRYEDIGERNFKNIEGPVRVFRVHPADRELLYKGPVRRSTQPSVVVLPFANMSAEKDQDYFCDGMAEEVINLLAQLANLSVVARTSAFAFKGRDLDVREIGTKLGVRSVLEGSVRKAGDRLRVTAQLIDVESGYHLWSERFDRELDDVFEIQDEISAAIVNALKVELAVDRDLPSKNPIRESEAYDLYLQGMRHSWRPSEQGYEQAIDCFERALEIEPRHSSALAGLANCYCWLSLAGRITAQHALDRALPAAERALELDDSLAEAHVAVANLQAYVQWQQDEAERGYLRAIEQSPGLASAYAWYAGGCLTPRGLPGEALQLIRRAEELDPLSPSVHRTIGEHLFWMRQYEEAILQLKNSLEWGSDLFRAHNVLATVYNCNGQYEEELEQRRQILSSAGRHSDAEAIGRAFSTGGGGESGAREVIRWYAERAKRRAERFRQGPSHNAAWHLSLLLARLEETEECLDWLEVAVAQGGGHVHLSKVHPWFDSVRETLRFQNALGRMGLES